MALNSVSSGGILRMITRGSAAIAMLGFTAVVASAGEVALVWSQDAASKCRFVAPRTLTTGPTFWTGACPGGKASGLGMLRRRDAGGAGAAFYGELHDGVPVIGAINIDGGYFVGKFTEGDLVQRDDEPQVRIDSFKVAAKAARAVSARFQAEKNYSSAQYYAQVAQRLDQQIE